MRQQKIVFSLLMVMFWISPAAWGNNDTDHNYFDNRERGWFWYEQPPKEEPPERKQPARQQDPQARLKNLQKQLEDSRALAVMEPTAENIKKYIEIQAYAMNQSAVFADQWKRVIWANPQLDNTVSNPVSAVGSWVKNDIRRDARVDAVRALARTQGLFYFYKASCPYCVAQAPILARFASMHGLKVMAISLDGSMLPEFPDARVDNGMSGRLGVSATPAMFMVNPRTQAITPVAYGIVSESELLDRIYTLSRSNLGQY